MRSKSGVISVFKPSGASAAQPSFAEENSTGKSSWYSLASSAAKRSKVSLCTSCDLASGLSTLLIKTIGRKPRPSALPTTNLVCGIGPSAASTKQHAINHTKDTFDFAAKIGAGVSTMLIRVSSHWTDVPAIFNATLAFLLIAVHARSATRWLSRIRPLCRNSSRRVSCHGHMGDDRDVSYVHLAPSIGCPDNCRASYSGGGWKQAAAVPYRSRIASLKSPRNGSSRYSITERVPVRMLAIICVPGNTS